MPFISIRNKGGFPWGGAGCVLYVLTWLYQGRDVLLVIVNKHLKVRRDDQHGNKFED